MCSVNKMYNVTTSTSPIGLTGIVKFFRVLESQTYAAQNDSQTRATIFPTWIPSLGACTSIRIQLCSLFSRALWFDYDDDDDDYIDLIDVSTKIALIYHTNVSRCIFFCLRSNPKCINKIEKLLLIIWTWKFAYNMKNDVIAIALLVGFLVSQFIWSHTQAAAASAPAAKCDLEIDFLWLTIFFAFCAI